MLREVSAPIRQIRPHSLFRQFVLVRVNR